MIVDTSCITDCDSLQFAMAQSWLILAKNFQGKKYTFVIVSTELYFAAYFK